MSTKGPHSKHHDGSRGRKTADLLCLLLMVLSSWTRQSTVRTPKLTISPGNPASSNVKHQLVFRLLDPNGTNKCVVMLAAYLHLLSKNPLLVSRTCKTARRLRILPASSGDYEHGRSLRVTVLSKAQAALSALCFPV